MLIVLCVALACGLASAAIEVDQWRKSFWVEKWSHENCESYLHSLQQAGR